MIYNNLNPTLSSSTQSNLSLIKLLENYLIDNPRTGYLIFQIYEYSLLYGLLPIVNAKITLSKPLGNGYFISKILTTDGNGKTEPISLPTVKGELSQVPGNSKLHSTYNACVEMTNYSTVDILDISIFDCITSIQSVRLLPKTCRNTQIYQANPQNLCEMW